MLREEEDESPGFQIRGEEEEDADLKEEDADLKEEDFGVVETKAKDFRFALDSNQST